MAGQSLFNLSLTFLFFLVDARAAKITVTNNCRRTIWPAVLSSGQQLPTTGFALEPKQSHSFNVPAPWSGRVWARTRCSTLTGKFACRTGDCGTGQVSCNGLGGAPPASLAELTVAPNGGQDFYDISLVDGFNLQVSMAPQGGTGQCASSTCRGLVNRVCPAPLQVKSPRGKVIGCKSACGAFNEPQFCCSGEFNDPNKCTPSNYSKIFKQQCPQAYSYAYDDKTSTFTCNSSPNYVITFCP